jgi:RNA polymerase sigma-70 factor (ECF subfamily)
VTKPVDQRLLNDLRKGCPGAYGDVVRQNYQAVYRFLVHMTRDVHKAEDLTQESFAAAWERIATFRGQSSLATWLHRIAYTKFIDAQRAERRVTRLHERVGILRLSQADSCDPVSAGDDAETLYRALDGLDAPERTLLVLHYLQGLSYREMATVLEEPSGTVKWRTSEALNRLRELLKDEVPNHVS